MSDTNPAPTGTLTGPKCKKIAIILLLTVCWLVCTIAQLEKYLSIWLALAISGVGCILICLLLDFHTKILQSKKDAPAWSAVCVFVFLLLSFALVYPLAHKHLFGKGSDREDALRVEIVALAHHQYPYSATTFLGHHPTPLPGAMFLAFPFYILGRIAVQNIIWSAIFLLCLTELFRRRSSVTVFMVILVCGALENLNDFDVGGDYLINVMYIVVAIYLFDRYATRASFSCSVMSAVVFLGVALSSRVIYLVTLPPLYALVQQKVGWKRASLVLGASVCVSLLVTLPVFSPHPIPRFLQQLSQNSDKLQHLPSVLPPKLLTSVGLACAGVSLFLRIDLHRVFLVIGMSTLIMIGPPMWSIIVAEGGFTHPLPTDLEYCAVPAIFIGLWAFAYLETLLIGHDPNYSNDTLMRTS